MQSVDGPQSRPARQAVTRRSATLLALLLVMVVASWTPALQAAAGAELDAAIRRCLITFAAARALGGALSLLQGTALAIQPMGLGLTLSLGQVLAPANDLVHYFSNVMLLASASLGIQKVLLVMTSWWPVSLLLTVSSLGWAAQLLRGQRVSWLPRAVILLLALRFTVTVAALVSGFAFTHFLQSDYEGDRLALEAAAIQADASSGAQPPQAEPSIMDRLKDAVSSQALKLKQQYEGVRHAVDRLAERLLRLLVTLLMQALVVPLLLVWLLWVVVTRFGPAARSSP